MTLNKLGKIHISIAIVCQQDSVDVLLHTQTVVSGYIGDQFHDIRLAFARELDRLLYVPIEPQNNVPEPPPFPRVKLSQFCPDALATSEGAKFRDGWFTLIGTWNEDPWTISLGWSSYHTE